MHRETQDTKCVLIQCYKNLGMEDEAEYMLKEVAFLREAVLGPNHPETITSKAQCAEFLFKRNKIKEAC